MILFPAAPPAPGRSTCGPVATRAFSSEKEESSVSVSLFKNPIVHQLWTARQKAKKDLKEKPIDSNICTISKSPADSRVQVSYPFSTDALLWDAYKNPWGQIRLGRLLEDLDALAGTYLLKHRAR